ncbi:MAG: hypothetical protein WA728_19060 [Xanthobacteraceae bacterium]
MSTLALPSRGRGRLSETRQRRYDDDLRQWCESIKEIDSTLDFKVSARGWCYILEQHQAIDKGDFDKGERIINACRKSGLLPLDICCEDDGRQAEHLETLDQDTPTEFAQGWIDYLDHAHQQYCPFSFWDGLDTYVQMTVEKVDLKSLFSSVCRSFHFAAAEHLRLERHQLSRRHHAPLRRVGAARQAHRSPALRRPRSRRSAHFGISSVEHGRSRGGRRLVTR